MRGVEGSGEQARVDGGCDEFFERAVAGQVERGEERGVGERGVGAGEREQGEEEELLVLLVRELGQVVLRCVHWLSMSCACRLALW